MFRRQLVYQHCESGLLWIEQQLNSGSLTSAPIRYFSPTSWRAVSAVAQQVPQDWAQFIVVFPLLASPSFGDFPPAVEFTFPAPASLPLAYPGRKPQTKMANSQILLDAVHVFQDSSSFCLLWTTLLCLQTTIYMLKFYNYYSREG